MSVKCPKCNGDLKQTFAKEYNLECTNCGAKCLLKEPKRFRGELKPYGEDAEKMAQIIKEQIAKNKILQEEAKLANVDGRVHLFCPIEQMSEARKWFEDHKIDPNDIVFKDEMDMKVPGKSKS